MRKIIQSFPIILFALLMVAFPLCYLFVHNSYQRQVFETALWTALVVFSVLIQICHPKKKKISWANLSVAILLFYVIINSYLNSNSSTLRLALYMGNLVICIAGLSLFYTIYSPRIHSILLLTGSLIFSSYVIFFWYNYFFTIEENNNPYQQNPSIFGILLTAQLLFYVPFWWKRKKNFSFLFNWLMIVLSCFIIYLIIISHGRAAWLGLIVGTIYLLFKIPNAKQYQNKIRIFSIPIFIVITLILLQYKSDSSIGRYLIYKISYRMLAEAPLTGIGTYGFSEKYNQYQANYFASHSINSREALLADNNWFAFNDYYQFVIENGLLGVLLLLTVLFLLIKKKSFFNKKEVDKNQHFALASIISILTSALFFYPLQFFPVVFHLIICISIINATPITADSKNNQLVCSNLFMLLAGICLTAGNIFLLRFNLKEKEAYATGQSGMLKLSLENYKELSNSPFADGNLLFQYSRKLFAVNQLKEAEAVIKQVKPNYSSNQVYKLSALIHQELGQYKEAEFDFKNAVLMVPNRIVNRYNLLSFYIKMKDTIAIKLWSKSILSMPIKAPSKITQDFQQKAEEIQRQIIKNSKIKIQ